MIPCDMRIPHINRPDTICGLPAVKLVMDVGGRWRGKTYNLCSNHSDFALCMHPGIFKVVCAIEEPDSLSWMNTDAPSYTTE